MGAEAGADNVGDGDCGLDILVADLLARDALAVAEQSDRLAGVACKERHACCGVSRAEEGSEQVAWSQVDLSLSMEAPHNLPAHATKHVQQLHYALPNAQLVLHQDNHAADSTGPSIHPRSPLLACCSAQCYLHCCSRP